MSTRLIFLAAFTSAACTAADAGSEQVLATNLNSDAESLASTPLTWTGGSCTPGPGVSKFHVQVLGLAANESAEFSLDKQRWFPANAGPSGYDVSLRTTTSVQYFHARRTDQAQSRIEGALATCDGPAVSPPRAPTPRPTYFGRWSGLDKAPTAGFPGAGIRLDFVGQRIAAELEEFGTEYVDVVVDNGPARTLALTPGRRWVTIVEGLAQGAHQVSLVRRNEAKFGHFTVRGYDLGGGYFTPSLPFAAPRRIQFVGDSNTAGYGNLGTACGEDAQFQHFGASYGAKLAAAFGAEVDAVAVSGIGVSRNMAPGLGDTMAPRYSRSLDFDANSDVVPQGDASAVYIQLGQNDFDTWAWPSAPTDQALTASMNTLLDTVRRAQPTAVVIVGISPGLSDTGHPWAPRSRLRRVYSDVVRARTLTGDRKLVFFELPEVDPSRRAEYLSGCFGHYTADYHTRIASDLVATIQAHTGWSVVAPIVIPAVQTGDIQWGSAGCTADGNDSRFSVSVQGLSAGVQAEFSLDNQSWSDANVGLNAYRVVVPYGAGGLQSFWARPKGYPLKAIWGALNKCN